MKPGRLARVGARRPPRLGVVSLHRGFDGSDPVRREPIGRLADAHEERKTAQTWRVATGTLACPHCDAPVAPGPAALRPTDPLGCPYCGHAGRVRDFLSLAAVPRPARVEVRVSETARPPLR